MKIADALTRGMETLSHAGIENAEQESRWMMEDLLHQNILSVAAGREGNLTPEMTEQYAQLLTRRRQGEPLVRILGNQDFFGRRFDVYPGVFIPRPATETLVEEALKRIKNIRSPKMLDVGTGSGAILLSVLLEHPDASGWGVDISDVAIQNAQHNAERFQITDRVHFANRDMTQAETWTGFGITFDLIVANPPYICTSEQERLPTEVRDHEPPSALYSGPDGLDHIRMIAQYAHRVLAQEGQLLIEFGIDQSNSIEEIFSRFPYRDVRIIPDLSGCPRVLSATS